MFYISKFGYFKKKVKCHIKIVKFVVWKFEVENLHSNTRVNLNKKIVRHWVDMHGNSMALDGWMGEWMVELG